MNYNFKKISVLLIPLGLLALGGWLVFAPPVVFPGFSGQLDLLREDIHNTQKRIKKFKAKNAELKRQVKTLDKINKLSMKDNGPSTKAKFRERIEKAAGFAGVRVRSLSSIRKVKVSNLVSFYEINLTADAEVTEAMKFMDDLYKCNPRIYWKSLNIRPNNILKPQYLVISGMARVISFNQDTKKNKTEKVKQNG